MANVRQRVDPPARPGDLDLVGVSPDAVLPDDAVLFLSRAELFSDNNHLAFNRELVKCIKTIGLVTSRTHIAPKLVHKIRIASQKTEGDVKVVTSEEYYLSREDLLRLVTRMLTSAPRNAFSDCPAFFSRLLLLLPSQYPTPLFGLVDGYTEFDRKMAAVLDVRFLTAEYERFGFAPVDDYTLVDAATRRLFAVALHMMYFQYLTFDAGHRLPFLRNKDSLYAMSLYAMEPTSRFNSRANFKDSINDLELGAVASRHPANMAQHFSAMAIYKADGMLGRFKDIRVQVAGALQALFAEKKSSHEHSSLFFQDAKKYATRLVQVWGELEPFGQPVALHMCTVAAPRNLDCIRSMTRTSSVVDLHRFANFVKGFADPRNVQFFGLLDCSQFDLLRTLVEVLPLGSAAWMSLTIHSFVFSTLRKGATEYETFIGGDQVTQDFIKLGCVLAGIRHGDAPLALYGRASFHVTRLLCDVWYSNSCDEKMPAYADRSFDLGVVEMLYSWIDAQYDSDAVGFTVAMIKRYIFWAGEVKVPVGWHSSRTRSRLLTLIWLFPFLQAGVGGVYQDEYPMRVSELKKQLNRVVIQPTTWTVFFVRVKDFFSTIVKIDLSGFRTVADCARISKLGRFVDDSLLRVQIPEKDMRAVACEYGVSLRYLSVERRNAAVNSKGKALLDAVSFLEEVVRGRRWQSLDRKIGEDMDNGFDEWFEPFLAHSRCFLSFADVVGQSVSTNHVLPVFHPRSRSQLMSDSLHLALLCNNHPDDDVAHQIASWLGHDGLMMNVEALMKVEQPVRSPKASSSAAAASSASANRGGVYSPTWGGNTYDHYDDHDSQYGGHGQHDPEFAEFLQRVGDWN